MTDTVSVPREMISRLSRAYDLGFEVEAEIEELRALLAAEPPAVEEVEFTTTIDQHHRIVSRLKGCDR